MVTNEVTTLRVNQFTKRDKKVTQIALIGIKTMTQANQIREKVEKLNPNMRENNGINENVKCYIDDEEVNCNTWDIEYDDASFDGVDIDYTTQS